MSEATAVPSSVDAHLAEVLDSVSPLDPLELLLAEAQGTLLAENVVAPLPLPSYDQATVDGYAVRMADVATIPASLAVIPAAGVVQPGFAVRIASGRQLPSGTEAVVPSWEAAVSSSNESAPQVLLRAPVTAGQHLRRTGEDVAAGVQVLAAGSPVGPVQIGLLAALGIVRAKVHPRPRVTVIATGDSLIECGEPAAPGRQYDATSHALAAACRDAGATAYRLPALPTTDSALTLAIEDYLIQSDVVLVAGDVRPSGYDPLGEVLSRLGEVTLRRVAMRPGPLQVFGRIGPDKTPIFVVPAAPVAAMVSFEVFVRPALRRMIGAAVTGRPQVRVTLTEPHESVRGERQYVRARVRHEQTRGYLAAPVRPGEVALTGLAASNALVVVPELMTTVPAGTSLPAVLLERRTG